MRGITNSLRDRPEMSNYFHIMNRLEDNMHNPVSYTQITQPECRLDKLATPHTSLLNLDSRTFTADDVAAIGRYD